jgi:hypothetical protein
MKFFEIEIKVKDEVTVEIEIKLEDTAEVEVEAEVHCVEVRAVKVQNTVTPDEEVTVEV